jgi:aminodeoxyfutalosine synthase
VTASLDDLAARVETGGPLSDEDVDALASSRDIIALGMLANASRRRIHGQDVTYVRVADLEVTGPTSTDVVSADGGAPFDRAGEVRLFHTPATLDAAIQMVEKARELAGKIPLSAFCLFELAKLPEGLPVVLQALERAGLESITQAPIDRLTSPVQALESLADAGLRLARLTVNETTERPWTVVCREVAAHQDALRSIRVFAPLPRKIDPAQPTTGYEDVRRIAIARLVVHNVDNIQVDWALYGPKLAQVALTFGADDIDSVSAQDDESRGHRRSPIEEIHRGIRAAGFEPIERDAHFERRH